MESKVITGNIANEKRGQWMGFVLVLLCFALAVFLILKGKSIEGVALLVTEFLSLASIFVYGKHVQRKDQEQKRKEIGITGT